MVLDSEYPSCVAARRRFDDPAMLSACKELPTHIEEVHVLLYVISLSILAAFVLELCLTLIAVGPLQFVKHGLYVLDAVVVIASLVIEIWSRSSQGDGAAVIVELLLFVR